jgi:hypothetical protein
MNCLQQLIFSLSSDRLFKRYVSTSLWLIWGKIFSFLDPVFNSDMRGTSLSSTESLSYFTSSSKKELSLDLHWQLGAKAHFCYHCFFHYISVGSLQVLPWNLRQLISYFFSPLLFIQSIYKKPPGKLCNRKCY